MKLVPLFTYVALGADMTTAGGVLSTVARLVALVAGEAFVAWSLTAPVGICIPSVPFPVPALTVTVAVTVLVPLPVVETPLTEAPVVSVPIRLIPLAKVALLSAVSVSADVNVAV